MSHVLGLLGCPFKGANGRLVIDLVPEGKDYIRDQPTELKSRSCRTARRSFLAAAFEAAAGGGSGGAEVPQHGLPANLGHGLRVLQQGRASAPSVARTVIESQPASCPHWGWKLLCALVGARKAPPRGVAAGPP